MRIGNYARTVRSGSSCWLLSASLLVNLLCIGVAAAVMIAAPASPRRRANLLLRLDQLAATLPPPDSRILGVLIRINQTPIQDARTDYFSAGVETREALIRQPFNTQLLREAMTKYRLARQNLDHLIAQIVVAAAAQMSPAGRYALAEWPADQSVAAK